MTKVLVTGVFDILHEEHINFLKKAQLLGDYLVIAIESDVRVKQIKGEDRPIHNQLQRKAKLESLHIADEVLILPEQFSKPKDHENFIKRIKPDFFAVSSHTKHIDKKRDIIEKHGGELVIVHQHNPKISSSKLIASLNK